MKIFGKPVAVALLLLIWCAGNGWSAEKVPVFVSILPQKTFVQQIGGDRVSVQVMVQPGASPATYEPKPRQMAALAGTRLYFSIGVPFENAWLEKIAAANPDMAVVHTDEGIHKLAMAAHHHDEAAEHGEEKAHEDHGKHHEADHDGDHHEGEHHEGDREEGHHGHHGLDPHVWLSPALVRIQAGHILSALKQADPGHAGEYEKNYTHFLEKISRLDAELKDVFKGKQGLQFMVFHPAWGYFAHAYGLTQVPIEIEGKDPKPAQLEKLIRHAREHSIRMVFVQPQFSAKSAEVVAREIGGKVAFADPLAEDWEANLQYVARQFKAALK